MGATVEAAQKSVAKTPSLLPILREAGVVDSGGQGLFRLFEGALLQRPGRPGRASAPRRRAAARRGAAQPSRRVRSGAAALDEGFGYETMFLLQAARREAARRRRDPGPLRVDRRSPCSSPATPGRSRSTSTTSGRTR